MANKLGTKTSHGFIEIKKRLLWQGKEAFPTDKDSLILSNVPIIGKTVEIGIRGIGHSDAVSYEKIKLGYKESTSENTAYIFNRTGFTGLDSDDIADDLIYESVLVKANPVNNEISFSNRRVGFGNNDVSYENFVYNYGLYLESIYEIIE